MFTYDWKSTPDVGGVWHGVLLDGRVLEKSRTTPSFPVSVVVRPEGFVTLVAGCAEGLTIWKNRLVTVV